MSDKRFFKILILIAFFFAGQFVAGTGSDFSACNAQTVSASPATLKDALAIQAELKKAGIELSPDEIRRGKEALDRQELQAPSGRPRGSPRIRF